MKIEIFSDIHLIGLTPCGQCWQKIFNRGGAEIPDLLG